ADAILSESDIFIIPDVLCNAGGVTVSYFEWVQDIQQLWWSEKQVYEKLSELMLKAFYQVRQLAKERDLSMRNAALSLGIQKVAKDMPGGVLSPYPPASRKAERMQHPPSAGDPSCFFSPSGFFPRRCAEPLWARAAILLEGTLLMDQCEMTCRKMTVVP